MSALVRSDCCRVVHGGRFTQPMVLHKDAIEEIRRLSDLAPLSVASFFVFFR